jgi:hypothetical protein
MTDKDTRTEIEVQSPKRGLRLRFIFGWSSVLGLVGLLVSCTPQLYDAVKQHFGGKPASESAAAVVADKPTADKAVVADVKPGGCQCQKGVEPAEKPTDKSKDDLERKVDEMLREMKKQNDALAVQNVTLKKLLSEKEKENLVLKERQEELEGRVKAFEVLVAQMRFDMARERDQFAVKLMGVQAALDDTRDKLDRLQSDLDRTFAELKEERLANQQLKEANEKLLKKLEEQAEAMKKLEEKGKEQPPPAPTSGAVKVVNYVFVETLAPCGKRVRALLPDDGSEVWAKCEGGTWYACSLDPKTRQVKSVRRLTAQEAQAVSRLPA